MSVRPEDDGVNDAALAALREAFDRQFATAPPREVTMVAVLAITVAGMPFAVRLASIGGLFADHKVVPYPSERASALGLVGVRGALIAVHDLAAALGYARAVAPRWLVLTRGQEPLALAFEHFDAQLRLTPEQVIVPAPDAAQSSFQRGAVVIDGVSRPLLDIDALARALAT